MKNNKRVLSLLAAGALILTAACSNTPAAESPTPSASVQPSESQPQVTAPVTAAANGVFEGKGSGYGGELSVLVTVDDGKMTDLRLLDNHESEPVSKRAFPILKDRILESQTPVVDSVSSATFTSYAVKTAVADAASQFGQDFGKITMATVSAEAPAAPEDAATQLVVVGGGPAGLAAAIAAKQSGVEDVILIEKLGILSGNGKFDMNFFDLINSKAMNKAGIEYTVEDFIEDKKDNGDTPERLRAWAEGEWTLDAWLRDMDILLNQSNGGTNHMAESDVYAGDHIQTGLEKRAYELGVDIRLENKGTDLIMTDGVCTGVVVETKGGTYNITADAVVVATGGFCNNKELLAKYTDGNEVLETSNSMGTTGDFVPVFEKNGMGLENMGKMSVFSYILNPRRDLTGGGSGFLLVNKNGERFLDEKTTSGLKLGTAILEQPDGAAFYLADRTLYEDNFRTRKHVTAGYYQQGETLEELAEKLGIDAAGLKAAVEDYNANLPEGARPFDAEGPYYGSKVQTANHMTKGGVTANERTQVLFEDGTVVPGLYAAGEVTWVSGAYSAAVTFGRIAGQCVAEDIL